MSLPLNGSSQFLSIADDAVLTLPDGDFSLGGWAKLTDNAGTANQSLVVWQPASGYATNYLNWIIYEASYAVEARRNKTYLYAKDADGTNIEKLGSINAGTSTVWQHLLLVRSGTTLTQYVDGVSAGGVTGASFDAINGASAFGLGTGYDIAGAGSNFLKGKIAEWAKWDAALDSGQRAALVAGAKPGDVGTPAWWLPLLGDKESDAGGLTTTLIGSPTFDADDHPVLYDIALALDPLAAAWSIVSPLIVHDKTLLLNPLAAAGSVVPPLIVHDKTLVLDPVALEMAAKKPWVTSRPRYPRPWYNGTIAAGGGL